MRVYGGVLLLLLLAVYCCRGEHGSGIFTLTYPAPTGSGMANPPSKRTLTLGVILPHSVFTYHIRVCIRRLRDTIEDLKRNKYPVFNFTNIFNIDGPEVVVMQRTPTTTDIHHALCDRFLSKNVSAILYFTNSELYGNDTASSQEFLQLAGSLGIPIIAWNADNSGLETKSNNSIILQLAPTIEHQSLAMLSILQRYSWHQFAIVTSQIAGASNFVEAVKDNINTEDDFHFSLLSDHKLDTNDLNDMELKLRELRNSDARIILLYATHDEAVQIVTAAKRLGLMGRDYVWIVTQSIIGNNLYAPTALPPGMFGIHFDTDFDILTNSIAKGVKVFGYGVELFINDPGTVNVSLQPNLSCSGKGKSRWSRGEFFYRYLQNVSVSLGGTKRNLEFNPDGTIRYPELEIMNLNQEHRWEKIGTWTRDGLDIKGIVWPGNSHVPPSGVPEKFHFKEAG